MFYHLLYPLYKYLFIFNVFQYITFRTGGAILTALFFSFLFGPIVIKRLKSLNINEEIRVDGPSSHNIKSGTPSMGGLIILFSLVISTLLWARLDNRFIIIILISTLLLSGLGFWDDYIKIKKKKKKGISPEIKILIQMLIALALGCYLYFYPPNSNYSSHLTFPFLKNFFINFGGLYILLVIFIVVGSSNAVNLTDGLDGLAIGCIVISAMTYGLIAYLVGNVKFSSYLFLIPVKGAGELTVFLGALVGAGLGFLWFNSHPAEIFMGDTGSLFLGGVIGITSILVKHEILLLIIGGVFVLEALSVLLQVFSYQYFGKRIFKMTPIHHHFELKGIPESKVVIRFWIFAIILSLIALSTLKLR